MVLDVDDLLTEGLHGAVIGVPIAFLVHTNIKVLLQSWDCKSNIVVHENFHLIF